MNSVGTWVDVTEDAYNWSSSNTAVATLPNSYASFVGIGSATGATYVQLQEAILRLNCPVNTYNPQNTLNGFAPTPSQHTYPSAPLTGACRVSECFDCVINTSTGAKHRAQDVVVGNPNTLQVGAPVYTAEAGTVTKVVSGNPHINQPAKTCAGMHYPANYVEVTGSDGYVTRYVHVTSTVAQNTPASAGQQIGTVDLSGCTSGPHVHMARHSSAGVVVNFTIPCDNSHFDPANTFYDDSDGLDSQ